MSNRAVKLWVGKHVWEGGSLFCYVLHEIINGLICSLLSLLIVYLQNMIKGL